MGRTSEVTIAILPVAVCLGVLYAAGVLSLPVGGRTAPRALAASTVMSSRPVPIPTIAGTPLPVAAPQRPVAEVSLPETAAEVTPTPASPDPMERGRVLAHLLYSQQLAGLWSTFQPALRQEWNGLPAFRAYRQNGLATYGSETRVLSEQVRQAGSVTYYTRTALFQRGPRQPWTLIFGLNPAGQVVEFGIVASHVLPGHEH